jgi:hypothetical protein
VSDPNAVANALSHEIDEAAYHLTLEPTPENLSRLRAALGALRADAVECSIIRDDIACGLVVALPVDELGHAPQPADGTLSERRFLVLPLEGESANG